MEKETAPKAAGKAITRPKAPDPLCATDSLVNIIKGFLSADSASSSQQAQKLYQETRLAKLEEIKVLNQIMSTATSQEMKNVLEKQIMAALEQLNEMKPPQVPERQVAAPAPPAPPRPAPRPLMC